MNALLVLGALTLAGGAVVIATSKATSSASGGGGKLGGATFDGKAYSDASITEGELADAAAHGDEAAKDELARRETVKTYHDWCGKMGLGDACDSYIKAGFDVSNAIAKAVSEDLSADANTPEQKKRLADNVGRIVSLGYPPTRFSSLTEFGVEEQADTIGEDINTILLSRVYNAPFIGSLDVSTMLKQAGRGALATAAKGGLASDRINNLFGKIAARRSVVGCMRLERPQYLFDDAVTPAKLDAISQSPLDSKDNLHFAMLAYLACAATGAFDMPLDKAFEVVANNAASFNARHGLTSRADTLNTAPAESVAHYPVSDCGPVILAEAWYGLAKAAGKTPAVPGLVVVAGKFDPFKRG